MNRMLERVLRKRVINFDYGLLNELAYNSMWSRLEHLAKTGFKPSLVVDAGAFTGDWTKHASRIFTDSKFLMIEAQSKKEPELRKVVTALQGRADLAVTLLGAESGKEVRFFDTGGTGASMFEENSNVKKSEVVYKTKTIDELLAGKGKPQFIKLDVQGAELEVLKGATESLKTTEFVLLEASIMKYNKGAPTFAELVAFMDKAGFEVFDLCDINRMPRNFGSVFQLDMIFVKSTSKYTQQTPWQ